MTTTIFAIFVLIWSILLPPTSWAAGSDTDNCQTAFLLLEHPRSDEQHFFTNQDRLKAGSFDFAKYFLARKKLAQPSFSDLAQEGPEALFAYLDLINLRDLKDGNYQTAYWEMMAHPRRMKKIARRIPSVFRTQTELANFALWYYQRLNGPLWKWRDFLRRGEQVQGQQSMLRLWQLDHFHRSLRQQLMGDSLPVSSWKDLIKYPGGKIMLTVLMNSHLWANPTGALLLMYLPHRQINLLRFDLTGLPTWPTIKREGLFTLAQMEAYLYRTGKEGQAVQFRQSWHELRKLQLQNGAISALLLGSYALFLYHTVQETLASLEDLEAVEKIQEDTAPRPVVDGPTREEAIQYLQEVMARHYQGGDPEELEKLQQAVPSLLK